MIEGVKKMDKNNEQLASRLSYEIIKEVAPNELDLFDDIKEEYLKNPDAFLEKDPKKKEKMLGFGGGGGEVFFTTTILPLIWGIIAPVGKAGIETLKDEGSKVLAGWIKDKMEKKGGQPSKPSKENLKLMRDYVYHNAISVGVEKEKADIVADSFIGKLAIM
jgi:hypothetical protein